MSRQIFTLGQRYWDAQTGSLYSGLVEGIPDENTTVKLTNKQQLLLKALMEAHPNILSYEELTREVWLGRVMSPESLPQLINRTRTALGDSDKGIIVNHPGSGYELKFQQWRGEKSADSSKTTASWLYQLAQHKSVRFGVIGLLSFVTCLNSYLLYNSVESERKFLKVIQSTPYPYVIKDENGRVTAINIGDYRCDYEKAQRLLKCNF
ncbi:winged helix-turn-helix domain-containing protein [Shewanella corallii]|uniref:Winged helix-turn-helix domain-containing protein n=1 Tax=Shewanella corallii TaxID=560080 RepID=A0ABT0N6U2_9GAMM|nr:winged helix-turn-helix domain-containing protein [Shewanella corallii]MCL2914171.1 winged helix-turn-helix domain-containing protein [Shewanella corallii]